MRVLLLLAILLFSSVANAGSINVPKHAPKIGNLSGNIQIVEFFDYRCGYCKKVLPTLEKIEKKHRDVQVVLIEYPIFGEASANMAKSALAVKSINSRKYFDYHKELMFHRGKFSDDVIKKISKKVGIDGEKVIKEMTKSKYDRYLKDNAKLAKTRHVRGTPHLVVDGVDIRGAVSFDDLDDYIKQLKSK